MIRAGFIGGALVVVGVAALSTVVSTQSKDRVLFSTEDASHQRVEFAVPGAKFCATKAWNPEKDPPPLATTAAVKAAINVEKPKKRWVVEAVSLQSASCIREVRWYYSVTIYDEESLVLGDLSLVDRVVLMDGSVVLPRPGQN
jgi:hypothetical protein